MLLDCWAHSEVLHLKCIKTSWKQDRISNRCRQCFMESEHELSPSASTTGSYILFVPLNVCLSNVSLPSMLSAAAAALEWVRTALMNPSALSLLNTKRVLLQSPVVWELSKRNVHAHQKRPHITSWLIIKGKLVYVTTAIPLGKFDSLPPLCVGQRAVSATEEPTSCWIFCSRAPELLAVCMKDSQSAPANKRPHFIF